MKVVVIGDNNGNGNGNIGDNVGGSGSIGGIGIGGGKQMVVILRFRVEGWLIRLWCRSGCICLVSRLTDGSCFGLLLIWDGIGWYILVRFRFRRFERRGYFVLMWRLLVHLVLNWV